MKKTIGLKVNWKVSVINTDTLSEIIKNNTVNDRSLEDIKTRILNGELASFIIGLVKSGHVPARIYETHNIVPNIFRYELAKQISGLTTPTTFEAKYIALGNDATPPDHNDTTLGNEILRSAFTNRYVIDNVSYLDKFFSSSDVSGNTYLEAGVFCDGSLTADTGYLLSKISLDETVGPNEVLTINCAIAITSVL